MLLIKKYVRLDLKIVRLPSPDPGFVSRLGWLGFFFGGGEEVVKVTHAPRTIPLFDISSVPGKRTSICNYCYNR